MTQNSTTQPLAAFDDAGEPQVLLQWHTIKPSQYLDLVKYDGRKGEYVPLPIKERFSNVR